MLFFTLILTVIIKKEEKARQKMEIDSGAEKMLLVFYVNLTGNYLLTFISRFNIFKRLKKPMKHPLEIFWVKAYDWWAKGITKDNGRGTCVMPTFSEIQNIYYKHEIK